MRNFRGVLKYTPAMLLGLLLVAWVVNRFLLFGVRFNQISCHVVDGSLGMTWENRSAFIEREQGALWRLAQVMPVWNLQLVSGSILGPLTQGEREAFDEFLAWRSSDETKLAEAETA